MGIKKRGLLKSPSSTSPRIGLGLRVFDLQNRPARSAPGLAVSPDKETILYTQLDALNSDILAVEDFR